jgi:hypothetical protein
MRIVGYFVMRKRGKIVVRIGSNADAPLILPRRFRYFTAVTT